MLFYNQLKYNLSHQNPTQTKTFSSQNLLFTNSTIECKIVLCMLHTVCNQLRTFLQFDRDKQAEIMI